MLCGGSDAVIIPIGANSFSYITLFPLFLIFKLCKILSYICVPMQGWEVLLHAGLFHKGIMIPQKLHVLGIV